MFFINSPAMTGSVAGGTIFFPFFFFGWTASPSLAAEGEAEEERRGEGAAAEALESLTPPPPPPLLKEPVETTISHMKCFLNKNSKLTHVHRVPQVDPASA